MAPIPLNQRICEYEPDRDHNRPGPRQNCIQERDEATGSDYVSRERHSANYGFGHKCPRQLHPSAIYLSPKEFQAFYVEWWSGWMQEEDFLVFLRHFVKHTRPTPESQVILLLDNHSSNLSIKGIDFCRKHGVVLLSFPPHCSHKIQPLDRSVYGPLKRYINRAMDSWMKNNPGNNINKRD